MWNFLKLVTVLYTIRYLEIKVHGVSNLFPNNVGENIHGDGDGDRDKERWRERQERETQRGDRIQRVIKQIRSF